MSQVSIQRLRAVLGDDTFAVRFTVEGEVGRGGMGSVHRAIERESKQPVAIKILHATAHQARFALEAETLERLSHPAIVAYVGHGVTRDGDAYLAMAWIDGESLAQRLDRGPLSIADALAAGIRIAGALAHAHAEGIVHRDIKPSNVMLVDKDPRRAMLIDFGIAKDTASTQGLTETGQLVGTPGYMSPEQAMGTATLDARTDMFAFGALLFHCLTGEPPFDGRQPMEVLALLLLRDPPPVNELRPEVPARLSTLISALLVKEPDKRSADAVAVEAELTAISNAIASADTATLAASSPLHVVVDAGAPTKLERPVAVRSRSLIPWIAGGLGVTAIALAFVVVVFSSKTPPDAPQPGSMKLACEKAGTCEQACAANDAAACREAGRAAYMAAKGDDVRQRAALDGFLDRGCALGDGAACSLAGAWIRRRVSRGDTHYTREHWVSKFNRGCELADGTACALLAEHLLAEGPANFTEALDVYVRACTAGNTASCAHAAEMLVRRDGPGDKPRADELRAVACKRGHTRSCK